MVRVAESDISAEERNFFNALIDVKHLIFPEGLNTRQALPSQRASFEQKKTGSPCRL